MAPPVIPSTSFKVLRAGSIHCRRPASTGLRARSIHATSSRTAGHHYRLALSTPTITGGGIRPSMTALATSRLHPPMTRSMFIQTETTPNEDSLKFIPGTPVMETGSAEFLDTRAALASPLALRLFGIEGVKAVFYGPDFVTVTKDGENYPWAVIKPEVYSVLMEHFSASSSPSSSSGGSGSGQSPPPLFRSEEDRASAGGAREDLRILETDSDTVAMIKELLDTRVRPAIMEDGGDIEYRGFSDEGIVKIKLKGSCRGCESSTVTLKTGIERMLVHYIPEVKGTEQVLDEEEKIAQDEFSKLEQRLHQKQHQAEKRDSDLAQYMST